MRAAGNTANFCTALLGGSFDPAHNGHAAIAHFIVVMFAPDELRILPAGNPWQKPALHASADDRVAMAKLAFESLSVPVVIDRREIERSGATYTIETLQELRNELGPQASLILIIGADQLQRLDTWRNWRSLFDFANLCAVSRPGFSTALPAMPDEVRNEFSRRMATPAQMRATPHGLCLIANGPAIDISSTALRETLRQGQAESLLLPPAVLDYIQQHHLYRH